MFTSSANVAAGAALACLALANAAGCTLRIEGTKRPAAGSSCAFSAGAQKAISQIPVLSGNVFLVRYENSTETPDEACARAKVDGVVLEAYASSDMAELCRMHADLWIMAPPRAPLSAMPRTVSGSGDNIEYGFPGVTADVGPHPEFNEYAQCIITGRIRDGFPGSGKTALNCGKSSCGQSPCRKSSCGQSPCGKSPCGKSSCGKSSCRKSPCGKSPCGKSPCGRSLNRSAETGSFFGIGDRYALDFEDVQLMPGQSARVVKFYQYLTTSANGSLRCCSPDNTGTFPKATALMSKHIYFGLTKTDPRAVIHIDESVARSAVLRHVNIAFVNFAEGDVVTVVVTRDKVKYTEELVITKDMLHEPDQPASVFEWMLQEPQTGIQTITVMVDIDSTLKTPSKAPARGFAITKLGLLLGAAPETEPIDCGPFRRG